MFEYTASFLNPFSWAKSAYEYTLGLSNVTEVSVIPDELISPAVPQLSNVPITIFTASDWNNASRNQVVSLGAIYQSTDQAEKYFNSLYTTVTSRLHESEVRSRELESNLNVLLSSAKQYASSSIHIKGGNSTGLETDEKYYRTFGPLKSVPEEGVFRLKDTGFFSSIRSLGGFAGQVILERSLGELVENGSLRNIVDGARNTFWQGIFYTPAPLKADSNAIPWLPIEYRHGYAGLFTYYLDQTVVATEVFIDPISTEPMDLVSISWSPFDLDSQLYNGTFEPATSGWTLVGSAVAGSGFGVGSTNCVIAASSTGWVSQMFDVPGNYLASGSTGLVSLGNRCHINYTMKGLGHCLAGARIIWYDASGSIIDYNIKEDYPTGFYITHRFIDFVPSNAASGRLDLGIFTPPTSPASAFFDNAEVFIGEKVFQANEIIDRPKTITLPEIARSGRFSFVLAQRNPRREILVKEAANAPLNQYYSNQIDSTLTELTKTIDELSTSKGTGEPIFTYRIGAKEIDFRYREHIPRGSLVSLPLFTKKEIREISVSAEIGQHYNSNTKFYIYPFANDVKQRVEISPYLVGNVDNGTTNNLSAGEILHIYSSEEQASGRYNPNDKLFIVEPRAMTETFDGTARDGKIKLSFSPHLRRLTLDKIQTWLDQYSVWPTVFDPNLETIFGINSSATITAIRNGTSSGFIFDDLVSKNGYLPIKVTIETDDWVAYPDVHGRPDISKVRTVQGEVLTETTSVETITDEKQSTVSFDSWLNQTKSRDISSFSLGVPINLDGRVQSGLTQYPDYTLRFLIDNLSQTNKNLIKTYEGQFRSLYNTLKAQGKISKLESSSKTLTSAIELDSVFVTKFKPIVTGPRGSFLKLYWYDPTNVKYLPIPQKDYEVQNSTSGLIKILVSAPASSYTQVLADYKYVSTSNTEDHFGSILSYVVSSVSATGITSNTVLNSRHLPITRNMTDYITGKIPELTAYDPDRLSSTFYPVIEYYVNTEGDLIFSREFFKYGNDPARIKVEYESLAIQPRVGVEVVRSGSPAATPTFYNISLRVREGSLSPTREVI